MTDQVIFTLQVGRTDAGLIHLGSRVDEIVAALGLGEPADYSLRQGAEEAVANLVMQGVPIPGTNASRVALKVEGAAKCVYLRVSGQCAAFDPLTVLPRSAIGGNPAERTGGFAVTLMRHHARDVRYARDLNTNHRTPTIDRFPS
jgi:hypothetical protein